MPDPISGVASCFAIVSLAIQLINTVQEIHDFLEDLKGIPGDVRSLITDLALLQSILEEVKSIAEEQRLRSDCPDPSPNLSITMKQCHHTLNKLKAFAADLEISSNNNKNTKVWATLKVRVRKQKWKGFENQLQQSMISLLASIALNSTRINLAQHATTQRIAAEISQISITLLEPLKHEKCSVPAKQTLLFDGQGLSTPCQRSKILWIHSQDGVISRGPTRTYAKVYRTFLGTFTYRMVTLRIVAGQFRARDSAGTNLQHHEATYTWIPPLLPHLLEAKISNVAGQISRNLRICPIIPSSSPVFQLINRDQVQELQTYLSSGLASPFSVDRYGWNLLHHAASSRSASICRLLLQLGVDADDVTRDRRSETPLHIISHACDIRSSKDIVRLLITMGKCDPMHQNSNGENFFMTYYGPSDTFLWALRQDQVPVEVRDHCCHPAHDSQAIVYKTPLHNAIYRFVRSYDAECAGWLASFRELIKMGSSLHCRCTSVLDAIYDGQYTNENLNGRVDLLLQTLNEAEIDLHEWAQKETLLRPDGLIRGNGWDGRPRRLNFEGDNGSNSLRVNWHWVIGSEEPMELLFQEFSSLAMGTFCPAFDISTLSVDDVWIDFAPDWSWTWPYLGNVRTEKQHQRFLRRICSKNGRNMDHFILRAVFPGICDSFWLNTISQPKWSECWPYSTTIKDDAPQQKQQRQRQEFRFQRQMNRRFTTSGALPHCPRREDLSRISTWPLFAAALAFLLDILIHGVS